MLAEEEAKIRAMLDGPLKDVKKNVEIFQNQLDLIGASDSGTGRGVVVKTFSR